MLAAALGGFSVMVHGALPGSSPVDTTSLDNADTIYDMTADFAKNWVAKKNADSVWKYGWSSGMHGDFTPFTQAQVAGDGNGKEHEWVDPDHIAYGTPVARLNTGGDFDDGNLKYKAGELMMQGGGPDWKDFAHIIFTAPTEGMYEVKATFMDQQHNMDADAHIFIEGESHFSAVYRGAGGTHKYDDTLALDANETVDFAVGLDSNFSGHPGLVGLSVTIDKH